MTTGTPVTAGLCADHWNHGAMTVEQFYAFADTRPDEEKWELIEGEPVLNAAPSLLHQRIAGNIFFIFRMKEREGNVPWSVVQELGVRVSDTSRPEPDVLVFPRRHYLSDKQRDLNEVFAVFEVLSPSTEKRDLGWKRKVYPSLASLTYYVVVSQDTVNVMVFARDDAFGGRRYQSLEEVIDLPLLGISVPLAEIYHDTGLM